MLVIILIILLVLMLGGFKFGGDQGPYIGGGLGLVLVILLILLLLGVIPRG